MSKTAPIFRLALSIQEERDALLKENYALRQVLQDLYDASPTSCDSDSLNQAQLAAEKVLGL